MQECRLGTDSATTQGTDMQRLKERLKGKAPIAYAYARLKLGLFPAQGIRQAKNQGQEVWLERFLERFSRHVKGGDGRARLFAIERDKASLCRSLGDMPADPAPLPQTFYATEAEALVGCATPTHGALLLYALVRALAPRYVVEVGAAHGYGAAYIGAALMDNGGGRLRTLEGMFVRERIAGETLGRLGLSGIVEVEGGDFSESVPGALAGRDDLDLVFIDGDKSVELTRSHFRLSLEHMPAGGCLFFDDIDFSGEIKSVWSEILGHPRVSACLTFFGRWGLLKIEKV